MNVQTRRELLQRLTKAINVIGPDFEKFGGIFLDHVLKTRLEHSGVNDFGFPVSRVVDSASDDGKVVAQYGARNGYFSSGMGKAHEDVDQAIKYHPNAECILLLADEPGRPIVIAEFKRALLAEPRIQGKSIRVWGSNRIAAWILRHLLWNDSAVEELSAFLPELAQIRDEVARDRLFLDLPPRHKPRPRLSEEISKRLKESPCLIISGLGGCGKSEAAAAYGRDFGSAYTMKIWLHRDDFTGVQALQALPLVRSGEKRNVANLLKTRSCLLVIDDPEVKFASGDLTKLCGPGSHVIVTIRERSTGDYPLPELLETEARAMLDSGVSIPCSDEVFNTIWQTVGGHPLSLSIMNAAAALDGVSWSEIEEDCDAIGELADRQQRIADRLLARYRDLLFSELSVFEWLKRPDCDANLLQQLIRPVGLRKLRERAMTAADRSTTIRLHDLVFASLKSLYWWTEDRRSELDNLLEAYLIAVWARNDLSVWAAATSARNRILSLLAGGDRRPAFVLAALTVLDFDDAPGWDLGDPMQSAADWAASAAPIDPLELRVAIETYEWMYLHLKQRDPEAAPAWAERGLAMFDNLERVPELTLRQKLEIRHHRGKALGWLKRTQEARAEFEAIMASEHPLEATRLQLLRSYKAEGEFEKAIDLGEPVIIAAEEGQDVSTSVLLAILESMPWRNESARTRVLRPRQEFIKTTIIDHANRGYNQAYQALAAVARYWSVEAPTVLADVLGAIPPPDTSQFKDDNSLSGMGDIFFEYGRTLKTPQRDETFERALSFFDIAKKLAPFAVQRKAELLIEMGRASEAESILRDHADLEKAGYVQRVMASALLKLDRAVEAQSWIDRALGDGRCRSHFHEFHELRYEIRQSLGDIGSVEDLREACRLAADGPVKDRLLALLASHD